MVKSSPLLLSGRGRVFMSFLIKLSLDKNKCLLTKRRRFRIMDYRKNAARECEGVITSRLDLWKSHWGFFLFPISDKNYFL